MAAFSKPKSSLIPELPKPKCALCGKEVQEMVRKKLADHAGYEVTVYCHGQKQTQLLSHEAYHCFELGQGKAFDFVALEHKQPVTE